MSVETARACCANQSDTLRNMHGFSDSFVQSAMKYESAGGANVMVFRPTMEEMSDFSSFLKYMESVGAHKACGVAKIIPPKEWHPRPSRKDSYLDMDDFIMHDAVRETIEGSQGIYTKYNAVFKKKLSVKDFRELALSKEYAPPSNLDTMSDLERFYWRNTTLHRPIYGADTPGSLYDENVDEWNINRLGTILDLIETECKVQIKGVNTAYLYFGMWKTTFPWHVEDMDLYSINYLHYGAPKFWYGISSDQSARFESLADGFFYQSKKDCRAYLRHKMHVISPKILKYHGIEYGTMVQNAGEFMVTFPKGYHAGFNCGYNCAESTNFALERWIDFGKSAVCCTCNADAVHIDMTPFMKKYRPTEYENWARYWYGDEAFEQMEGLKNTKCQELTKFNQTGVPTIYHGDDNKRKNDETETDEEISCTRPAHVIENSNASNNSKSKLHSTSAKQSTMDMAKRAAKLWLWRKDDFRAACTYNTNMALEEPHCAVCQYFVSRAAVGSPVDKLPEKSRRLISNLMLTREPSATLYNPLNGLDKDSQLDATDDYLIQCDQCKVAVHSRCYGVRCGEAKEITENKLKWLCAVCTNCSSGDFASTSCRLCVMRAGAMLPCVEVNEKGEHRPVTYAHAICALFTPGAEFKPDGVIYLKPGWSTSVAEESKSNASSTNLDAGPAASCSTVDSQEDLHASVSSSGAGLKRKSSNPGPLVVSKKKRDTKKDDIDWRCDVCDTSDGYLVMCSACRDDSMLCVHVTCGLHNGMSYEFRDWPALVALVCPNHNTYDDGSAQLEDLAVGSRVIAWLNQGELVARGTINDKRPVTFCVVDFMDGSHTNDTPIGDIEWCECAQDGCNGAHRSRARVKLDDGSLHDCTREDLFGENEKLPDIVLQRVQSKT